VSKPPPDTRSPIAIAYAWAWRVITISLEMVIPGLMGIFIDRWLGWLPVVFTILGFGLGMTAGILHLMQIASALNKSESITDKPTYSDEKR
jgi:prepilin signal peptidase PulO-like enzyme (type II secretory pathway)